MRFSFVTIVTASAFALILALVPARSVAQSEPHPRSVWASLALGPSTANGGSRLGGDIAVWLTRDRLAVWIRDATATRAFEPGDLYDVSVLAGIHPVTDRHVDFVAGAGLGIGRGHDNGGGVLRTEPVLALGAQLNVNYRVAGVGVDGFATLGDSRAYYGVGLALALGWFR
jgi:hypothetical protein